jgi:hypothetical protein
MGERVRESRGLGQNGMGSPDGNCFLLENSHFTEVILLVVGNSDI